MLIVKNYTNLNKFTLTLFKLNFNTNSGYEVKLCQGGSKRINLNQLEFNSERIVLSSQPVVADLDHPLILDLEFDEPLDLDLDLDLDDPLEEIGEINECEPFFDTHSPQ